jgi:hypothetical protein
MKDGFLVSDWADDTIGKRIEEKKGVCVPRCVLPQHTGVQCSVPYSLLVEQRIYEEIFSFQISSTVL